MKLNVIWCWILLLATIANASPYVFNSSDFATQVVDYVEGSAVPSDFISGEKFNNPAVALGRPTVDTTGDGFFIPVSEPAPVVPVSGAFRASELVTVGQGGQLTLKFDHQVVNDPKNPFGVDLIVFGNATLLSKAAWVNRDPTAVAAGGQLFGEGGDVSVSQDGQSWFHFANGKLADTFAPTLGRVYDPAHADPTLGAFNQWWAGSTNPTLPLDPSLDSTALDGKSVAEIAQLYGDSAGGTGFDLADVGLPWIQFVRIENFNKDLLTPEIDAIVDVAAVPEPGTIGFVLAVAIFCLRRKEARS